MKLLFWSLFVQSVSVLIIYLLDGLRDGIMISKAIEPIESPKKLNHLWHWSKWIANFLTAFHGAHLALSYGLFAVGGDTFQWVVIYEVLAVTSGIRGWQIIYKWSKNKEWPDWA